MKLSFDELVDRLVQYQNRPLRDQSRDFPAMMDIDGVSYVNPADDERETLLSILTSTGDYEIPGAGIIYPHGYSLHDCVAVTHDCVDFNPDKLTLLMMRPDLDKAVETEMPEHLMFKLGVLLINTAIFSNHARRNPGLYRYGPKQGAQ